MFRWLNSVYELDTLTVVVFLKRLYKIMVLPQMRLHTGCSHCCSQDSRTYTIFGMREQACSINYQSNHKNITFMSSNFGVSWQIFFHSEFQSETIIFSLPELSIGDISKLACNYNLSVTKLCITCGDPTSNPTISSILLSPLSARLSFESVNPHTTNLQ